MSRSILKGFQCVRRNCLYCHVAQSATNVVEKSCFEPEQMTVDGNITSVEIQDLTLACSYTVGVRAANIRGLGAEVLAHSGIQ